MYKKSQITLFIIIGLVLIISIAIFYFYINNSNKITIESQSNDIKKKTMDKINDINYAKECTMLFSEEGVYYLLGKKQIFFNTTNKNYEYLLIPDIPTYKTYDEIPELTFYEEELKKFISAKIKECISAKDSSINEKTEIKK
jgi:uncharacterized protein (UPF0333 family)